MKKFIQSYGWIFTTIIGAMLFSLGFVAVVVIVDYFRRILFQSLGRLTVFIRIRNILHRNRQS